jgi:hypothetical protein
MNFDEFHQLIVKMWWFEQVMDGILGLNGGL